MATDIPKIPASKEDFEQKVRFVFDGKYFEFWPEKKPLSKYGLGCIVDADGIYVCNVTKVGPTGLHWFNYTFGKPNSGLLRYTKISIIENDPA